MKTGISLCWHRLDCEIPASQGWQIKNLESLIGKLNSKSFLQKPEVDSSLRSEWQSLNSEALPSAQQSRAIGTLNSEALAERSTNNLINGTVLDEILDSLDVKQTLNAELKTQNLEHYLA